MRYNEDGLFKKQNIVNKKTQKMTAYELEEIKTKTLLLKPISSE